ncbi:VWA domain-containing protein [Tardiphaga alba]|uniref:VWA domain-containing protein n=1 Tax=Tardiphaga alba TaxID=340268 RepID=A0ABX8A627_9BRAD|nr:DUF5801 repeats-in-toxin domain-containing protein [Tardiphaga alba]QUS39179.1 VWA domain-containing protein [Tardiphaga alba]
MPDPTGVKPIGEIKTSAGGDESQGQLQALFGVYKNAGADGEKSTTYAYSFSLTGAGEGGGVATQLHVTDATGHYSDTTIYLFRISDTEIVGYVGNSQTGDIALRLTLTDAGNLSGAQFIVDQYMAIDHGNDGNNFDSIQSLLLAGQNASLGITLTATITDNDGDKVSDSATVSLATNASSGIDFQDDGPTLSVAPHNVASNDFFFSGFTPYGNWGANSGIATGTSGSWTIGGTAPTDPNNPDQYGTGTIQLERVGDGYQGMHTSTGGFMVDLDATARDISLTQTVNGLVPGQTYILSFEAGAPVPGSAHLQVWFGGQLVADIDPTNAMKIYTVEVTAGSGSNVLEFRETGAPDNQGTYLANVKIVDAIVIDETPGVDAASNETTDPAIIALFNGVNNKGSDAGMGPAQYATGKSSALDVTVDFGTDGPQGGNAAAATVYNLIAVNGTFSGLSTSAGQAIQLFSENGGTIIVGRYDSNGVGGVTSADNAAFAITINPQTGVISIVQYVSLSHPDHNSYDEGIYLNSGVLKANVTVTDGDGDHVSKAADISGMIRFEDDGPSLTGKIIERTVDEDDIRTSWSQGNSPNDGDADGSLTEGSTGAAIVTGSLSSLVKAGADDPGKFSFTATAVNQLQALHLFSKETATGNGENGKELVYSNPVTNGNEIVITAYEPNPQGNPVFSITLNTVTGAYEFRLFDELIHTVGDGENTMLRSGPDGSISGLDLGSIINFTDRDGDSINLGGKFIIKITDDVPHADIDIGRGSVTIDESAGNQADDTTSAAVKNQFASIAINVNGALAYARSDVAVVVNNSDIGADSPPYPHQYALGLAQGVVFSGLYVTDGTATGSKINLSVNDAGLVIGTVAEGALAGQIAFAIAIASDGRVSVAQYLPIRHDDRGDFNESNDNGSNSADASPNDTPNPVQQNLDGKITVTLTVKDSDGDTSTDTVNIGKLITFLDDGPSVSSNAAVALEDDDLPGGIDGGPGDDNAPLNATGTLSHDYGADGPGKLVLTGTDLPAGFSMSLASDGLSMIISQGNRPVLKIELTNDTDGAYKVTQLNPIDHPTLNGQNGDDTENNLPFTVKYSVTDGDGDTITGSIKIDVDDDSPEPKFILQSGASVTIDETAGLQNATATPNVVGDKDDNDVAIPFPVAVTNPGNPGSTSTLNGAPAVAQSAGPVVVVTPNYGADGPGSTVFAIDVPGNNAVDSGLRTTVGDRPIYLFEVNSTLIVGRYDVNGGSISSSDPAAFAIHIDPTTGKLTVVQYVAIEHDDRGDFDEYNDNGSSANDASPDDGRPIQQAITNGAVRVTVTVTDHDGDSVSESFNIGNKIVFEDDGPTVQVTVTNEASVVLETQDAETIGQNVSDTAVSTADFSGVFGVVSSFGADGAGPNGGVTSTYKLSLAVSEGTPTGLLSNGLGIRLYIDANGVITGSTATSENAINAGNSIFRIEVSSDGTVKLTQFAQIDHLTTDPTPTGAPYADHVVSLADGLVNLTRTVSVTDGDGDKATSSATVDLGGNIRFDDDGPKATPTTSRSVDEDDLGTGNQNTNSPGDDGAAGPVSFIGTLGFSSGADAPATVGFGPLGGTAVVDANGVAITSGGLALTYLWVSGTNTLYATTDGTTAGAAFSIQVTNPSTGAYSFSLLTQLDHPGHDADGQNDGPQTAYEDNLALNLTYTVKDFDGDTATGTLSISIDDDMPIIGAQPGGPPVNLIVNGSFEQHGALNNAGSGFGTFTGITGWTYGSDHVPFEIQVDPNGGATGGLAAQDGNSKVELDSDPSGNSTQLLNATIQQTISTPLTEGDVYELTFWYAPRPDDGNPDSSSMNVIWNGNVVYSIDSTNQPAGWQLITVYVTAQAGSNTVGFQGSGQANQLGAFLDNVSLVAMGEVFVDEDGLTGALSQGNHDSQPGDKVVANTDNDNNEATSTGNLYIKWGADDADKGVDGVSGPFNAFVQDAPGGVGNRSVTFTNTVVAVTGVGSLLSHGEPVTFVLNADKTVLTGMAGDRAVIQISLSDEGSGKFRVVLLDQLDHAPGGNENDIHLSFNFTATDSDGDAVNGSFKVGINDDMPVAATGAYVTGQVDEDDLSAGVDGDNSTGIPAEGNGPSDSTTDKFTFTKASLNNLIANIGADETGSVILQSAFATGTVVKDVDGHDVKSHGVTVKYAVSGNDVVGFADANGNGQLDVGEKNVFRLSQSANGDIKFDLQDQIDHPYGSGDGGILELNLSAAVVITDYDGDKVPVASGAFTVKVENDIPANTSAYVQVGVAEDYLSTSATPPDAVSGNQPGTAYSSDKVEIKTTDLLTLVVSGADDDVQFSLNQAVTGMAVTVDNWMVTSHGSSIILDYVNGQIIGFADTGSANYTYEAGDRIVFTLTPSATGFVFDLRDKIDHNNGLATTGSGDAKTLVLDLSKALVATDFDGDAVNLGLGSIRITIENDIPVAGVSTVNLDEDGLANGNPGGVGDYDPSGAPNSNGPITVNAALNVNFGADGAGSTAFLTSAGTITLPANGGFTVGSASATSIVINQNGVGVLQITLTNPATGAYTVTQLKPIDHPDGSNENDVSFTIGYQATDYDGDTSTGSFTIVVNDDTPTIVAATGALPSLTVDETVLTTDDTASFAGNFTAHYGADGAAASGGLTYAVGISAKGADSGLTDTATGHHVFLFLESGVVVGREGADATAAETGQVVFKVSVNAAGDVTLDQQRPVVHDNANNPDEGRTLSAANLVTLTATITDHDNDSATATLNIGQSLTFKDDGPSINVIQGAEAAIELTTHDALTIGSNFDTATAAANFGAVFSIGSWSYGADGAGTPPVLTYALSLVTAGGDSGLNSHGADIHLYTVGGVVVGSTSNVAPISATDPSVVFSLSVDGSGVVTLTQYQQIDHTVASSGSYSNDVAVLANDLVKLTATATVVDRDQDSKSDSETVDLGGNIRFTDDGPSAQNTVATVVLDDEKQPFGIDGGPDDLAGGNLSVASGDLLASGGADGIKSFAFSDASLTVTNSANATGTTLSVIHVDPVTHMPTTEAVKLLWVANGDGGTLYGLTEGGHYSTTTNPAFTLTVDGSGHYTFSANAPFSHPFTDADFQNNGPDVEFEDELTLNFTYTVKDGDNDTATATLSIKVDDDTPDAVSESYEATEGRLASANIVLVIDTSGSMEGERLTLAKQAAVNLLNSPNVDFNQIMVVNFSGGASINTEAGHVWTSKQDAINYINGLTAGGNTNYDAAVGEVISQWGGGPTAATKTLLYFITDGQPSSGGGLNSAEQLAWETFLANNHVDASYAVGIDTSVTDSDLTPIAWAPGNANLPPVVIQNASDLNLLLQGSLPGNPSGNILSNDHFGADGGYIQSVTIGGVVFTFNGDHTIVSSGTFEAGFSLVSNSGTQIVVNTAIGGKIIFNFASNGLNQAGDWDYLAPSSGIDNQNSIEAFKYTLVDGDGDGSSATLTITVKPSAVPSIEITPASQDVHEAGLPPRAGEPAGSAEAADGNPNNNSVQSEAVSGSFKVISPDALASIKIVPDGNDTAVTITLTQLNGATPGAPVVIDTAEGKLEITGYNANTGVVTYVYTLQDNQNHAGGAVTDVFTITATDVNNDTSPAVTLTINIVDDLPVAVADTDSIAAGSFAAATGNVISGVGTTNNGADSQGADGVVVAGVAAGNTNANLDSTGTVGTVVNGTYGKLTLNADGSYSYARNPGSQGGVSDVFTYTVKDGDGDLSHTTLTIAIGDTTPASTIPAAGGATTTVYEAGLPARGNEPAGSNAAANSETTSGTISFTSVDGLQAVSLGGHALTTASQTFSDGLTASYSYNAATGAGTITYSYTLQDNTLADPSSVSFAVVVTDADGDAAPAGNLVIKIVDDAPVAVADTDSIAAGSFAAATGNVISGVGTTNNGADSQGADGVVVAGVAAGNTNANLDSTGTVGTVVNGTYGKLTLNADGSYSYARNPGSQGGVSDVFTYTVKDGDGDLSHTTLTIAIGDTTPTSTIPAAGGATTTVYEAGLPARGNEPAGSNAAANNETTSGTISFTSVDGLQAVSLGGHALTTASQTFSDGLTASYSYNAATGAGTITYSYTLQDNTLADPSSVSFAVVVTDADGDTAPAGNLVITIVDDAPVAVAGPNFTVAETASATTGVNLLANDTQGADGAKLTHVSFDGGANWEAVNSSGTTTLTTTNGTYVFQANGDWSFDPSVNASTSDTTGNFTYRITDGDGDMSTAVQVVNITNTQTPLLLVGSNAGDIVGQGAGHTVANPQGQSNGELVGSGLDDKIVGDTGSVTVTSGQKANIVLVLDRSPSMTGDDGAISGGTDRFTAMKNAVTALLDSLGTSGASAIRVHVVQFDGDAQSIGTFDIVNGAVSTAELTQAKTAINGMLTAEQPGGTGPGGTNYEAALYEAYKWINGDTNKDPLANADINKVLFISDGEPNYYMSGEHGTSTFGNATSAMQHVLGTANGDNNSNEVKMIKESTAFGNGFTIDAIGIAISDLSNLNDVEDGVAGSAGGGSALNVTTAAQLVAAVSVLGGSTELAAAGNDSIKGGAGADIIFGDVLNTDALKATYPQIPANLQIAGSGWAVIAWLETNVSAWGGRAGTLTYIQANHQALSVESGRTGGNDIIDGGTGDDIIYGQEGNDQISGGDGNDTITGGTGVDTMTGGAGNDTFRLANGEFVSGESIDGGADNDTIVLTNATVVDFTTGTITGVETVTGSSGNDTVTMSAQQWAAFNAIDLAGGTDALNVRVSGIADISTATLTSVANTETGGLSGSAGNDTITLRGDQLDAILIGAGTIDLGLGTNTINLKSTSSDLNGLSDTALANVQTISAATAAAAVTITLASQSENLTVTGSSFDDTLTGGSGADTIAGGAGNDTITGGLGADVLSGGAGNDTFRLANGDFVGAESIDGGADTDTILLTNATVVNFTTGTLTSIEKLTGSTGDDNVTLTATQLSALTSLDLAGGTDTLQISGSFTSSSDAQIEGVENITLTGASTLNLSNQNEGFTITGSSGADSITGGLGDDTIIGAQNDTLLNGGGGNDTLQLGANFNNGNNAQIVNIENVVLTAAVTVNLSNQTEGFRITGSSGADSITGGSGDDTIIGAQNDTLLNGGGGTDTLVVGANFTSANNNQIQGIEIISAVDAAAGVKLNFNNQTEALTILGSAFSDTIVGGSGNDILTGNGGADQFRLRSNGGTDTVTDYIAGTDKIGFLDLGSSSSSATGSVNFAATTGTAAGASLNSTDFQIRATITAIAGNDDNHVVRLTDGQTTNQITTGIGGNNSQNIYVLVFNTTTQRGEIWFDTDWDDVGGRTKVATLDNVTTLDQLTQITAADIVVYNSVADPIVLDLGTPGISFSSLDHGVKFDINHDDAKDQIAWTNGQDGLLALDVDRSGKIESGSELFTPDFAGGHFADGIAALASLDSNHDGVIDSHDQAFGDLVVWQDANHNGVSDEGELFKLGDLGITGIDLAVTASDTVIDGQSVPFTGTFTYADGTKGTFVEVDFDTVLGEPGQTVTGTDGVQDVFAVSGIGAGHVDTITNFNGAEGDKLDLSALLDAVFEPGANVENFVHLAQSENGITVQVDTTGQGNFAGGAHDVAVLANYGAVSHGDIVNMVFAGTEHQLQATG